MSEPVELAKTNLFQAMLADAAQTVREIFPNAAGVVVRNDTRSGDEGRVWYAAAVLAPEGQDLQLDPTTGYGEGSTALWDQDKSGWWITESPACRDEGEALQSEFHSLSDVVQDSLNDAYGPFLAGLADRFYTDLVNSTPDGEPVVLTFTP